MGKTQNIKRTGESRQDISIVGKTEDERRELGRRSQGRKTKRRREKERRAGSGCKTPPSIFNTVEPLQMMGESKGGREGGRRRGEKERVGSCSRVKGCHGDSAAERGMVRLEERKIKVRERKRVKRGKRKRRRRREGIGERWADAGPN